MGIRQRLERLEDQYKEKDIYGPLIVEIDPRRANGTGIFSTREELWKWWDEMGFTQPRYPLVIAKDGAQSQGQM